MKAISLFLLVMALVLCGCGNSDNSTQKETNSVSSGNPITAPVDYLGAVANAKQHAVKTIDVSYLTEAIRMFNVSEGRYPKDLQELVAQQYIGKIPAAPYGQTITYNPTNGEVKVVQAQ